MVKNYYLNYSIFKLKRAQNLLCVLFFAFAIISFSTVQSQTSKTSTGDGNWATLTWNPGGVPIATDNAIIDTKVTIPLGTSVEINDLRIASNGILIVNGNLKVNGNITMDNKSPEFIMGNEAIVTVTGNFLAANKIDISISSYLIIQGDFKKSGSTGQGSLSVDDGHIYIFGDVDGFPELTSCGGSYDGSTAEQSDTCDYGIEEDFINNQESFPPEVQNQINCFNLNKLDDVNICSGLDAIFKIDPIAQVSYQWQVKENSGGWKDIAGENSNILTLRNTTVSLSGYKFRAVVKSTSANSNCKIGISDFAVLTVKESALNLSSISGANKVCPATSGITYNINVVNDATNYTWTLPTDWILESSQNSNEIIVTSANSSGNHIISVSVENSCGTISTQNISVDILGSVWTGALSTDWNNTNNWSCNLLPTNSSDVLIPNGLTNYPILNGGPVGQTNSLVIDNTATLRVLDNSLEIYGAISNSGIINTISGTLSFRGSIAQVINPNGFLNNSIKNLIIDNVTEVSISEPLKITGILNVKNGLLNSGGNLHLISNSTQTALIDGSGQGTINGNVTMQRFLDTSLGYKYFSSPFNNSIVGDFSSYVDLSASFPQVYNYDESNNDGSNNDISGWKSYIASTLPLGILEGFAFNFGATGGAVTLGLTGTVNNGDFSRQLKNTNGIYTDGFNLVGNPYPSPIDWNASGWTKTNIDDGIYFFSASSQYKGTYTSFVNNVSSSDGASSNIIPSMQGFFVHVSDGGDKSRDTNGSLALTNEVRVNDFSQQFIKESELEPVSLIRLSAGIKGNRTKDAMVIYFDPLAEISFEKNMDALKLMNTDEQVPNFYSLSSKREKLSINALPEFLKNTNQRISLGIRSDIDGEMSIELKDLKNLPANFNVYLIDDVKRVGQNLSEKSTYHFNIKAGEYNSRFYLIFSEIELSDPALAFDEPFSINTLNGKVYVNLNLEDGTSGTLRATTVTGQILEVRNVTGSETISLDGIRSSGIYFINLSWKDQQFSRKIMIQK